MQKAILPALRLPLLVNAVVGLIISAVLVSHGHRYWSDYTGFKCSAALLAFYPYSMLCNVGILLFEKRRLGEQSPLARAFGPGTIGRALLDLLLGIAFLVLHIVMAVQIAREYCGVDMGAIYNCFFALSASFFQFALSAHGIALSLNVRSILQTWETWRLSMTQCPTCAAHAQGRESLDSDAPIVSSDGLIFRADWKAKMSAANEEGETEGDRLIVVDANEA